MLRVLFAGGGTGGHLFPGLAVADTLREKRPDTVIAFAGTERGIEARIIPQTPYALHLIPVAGLVGKGLTATFRALTMLPAALAAAHRVLAEFKPDLVVGVGGYASAPVLFAAGLRRIPRVILEQNAIPGLTNRIFGPSVDRVFLAFGEAQKRFRRGHFMTPGNPVRPALLRRPRSRVMDQANPHLLVFGGSQGAAAINNAMVAAAPLLLAKHPGIAITHQTGRADHQRICAAYEKAGINAYVLPFIDDMATAYGQADLVVCRSGATTVAELTALGVPSLLIPLPTATHGHQAANARALEANGAAVTLLQPELSGERLAETVSTLLNDTERLRQMGKAAHAMGKPEAAAAIADECLSLIPAQDTEPTR